MTFSRPTNANYELLCSLISSRLDSLLWKILFSLLYFKILWDPFISLETMLLLDSTVTVKNAKYTVSGKKINSSVVDPDKMGLAESARA